MQKLFEVIETDIINLVLMKAKDLNILTCSEKYKFLLFHVLRDNG